MTSGHSTVGYKMKRHGTRCLRLESDFLSPNSSLTVLTLQLSLVCPYTIIHSTKPIFTSGDLLKSHLLAEHRVCRNQTLFGLHTLYKICAIVCLVWFGPNHIKLCHTQACPPTPSVW
ncbi:unnamed protein product [Ectocarpus sp. 12 AP-2014]